MLKKISHFLRYNNAALLILVVIFIAGSGVWAQTETGQKFIGEKQNRVENIDNTLLLELDPDNFNMDFKIERIESDEKYYYVVYTYLDLVKKEDAWEYELLEKTRKVSKKLKKDLGLYLGKELEEDREARIKTLKKEKERAEEKGPETRVLVEEYSGLIGKTLALGGKIFNNYEAVKTSKIPSPSVPPTVLALRKKAEKDESTSDSTSDNLSLVYEEALNRLDSDGDKYFNAEDNCPEDYNPGQEDIDEDGKGDVCDFDETIPPPDFTEASGTDDIASSGEDVVPPAPEESGSEEYATNSEQENILDSGQADASSTGENSEENADSSNSVSEPKPKPESESESGVEPKPEPEPAPNLEPEPDVEIIELPK